MRESSKEKKCKTQLEFVRRHVGDSERPYNCFVGKCFYFDMKECFSVD